MSGGRNREFTDFDKCKVKHINENEVKNTKNFENQFISQ